MTEVGWAFTAIRPNGSSDQVLPQVGGSIAYNATAAIRKTLTGLTWDSGQLALYTPGTDRLDLVLTLDTDSFDFGTWYATASSEQQDIALIEGAPNGDLTHVDYGDGSALLRRTTATSLTVRAGTNPDAVIRQLVELTGLDTSVADSAHAIATDVSWAPYRSFQEIIDGLAPFAGHRPPWVDFHNVFKSRAATVVDTEVIDLLDDLHVQSGSITVTNSYLEVPNQVVVYDDSADFPLLGVWNAPASAPHSLRNRGYVITTTVSQQGLETSEAARLAAETLGEQLTARKLSVIVEPTALLDGPAVLGYRDALWLVQGWSVDTTPGATMKVDAVELVMS